MVRSSSSNQAFSGVRQDDPLFPLPANAAELVEAARQRLAVPEGLLQLKELDVLYHAGAKALWTFMRPVGHSSFTPTMLHDFERWQDAIGQHFGPGGLPLDYLILGSGVPGAFSFGGDVDVFVSLIHQGDRASLVHYGHRCVDILYANMRALDLPILTIGLVQGRALGGGFDALLSFDIIIAERGAIFDLPDTMFGLFPAMGAHAILSRKLGHALADRIIQSGGSHTAEDLYDLGIVTELAEPGCGVAMVRRFMAKSSRRHAGLVNARRAMRLAAPIELAEMRTAVDSWADTALQSSESDLKMMLRLVGAQTRLDRSAA
jgi:DSF synthase